MTAPLEAIAARVLDEHFSPGECVDAGHFAPNTPFVETYCAHVATEIAAALRADEGLMGRLVEVADERARQDAKWGEQNHPNGTGGDWSLCSGQHAGWAEEAADDARRRCQEASERVWGDTYALILNEEVAEAFAESDPTRLREELVQVAAVAVAWIEKIDRDARAALDAITGSEHA